MYCYDQSKAESGKSDMLCDAVKFAADAIDVWLRRFSIRPPGYFSSYIAVICRKTFDSSTLGFFLKSFVIGSSDRFVSICLRSHVLTLPMCCWLRILYENCNHFISVLETANSVFDDWFCAVFTEIWLYLMQFLTLSPLALHSMQEL